MNGIKVVNQYLRDSLNENVAPGIRKTASQMRMSSVSKTISQGNISFNMSSPYIKSIRDVDSNNMILLPRSRSGSMFVKNNSDEKIITEDIKIDKILDDNLTEKNHNILTQGAGNKVTRDVNLD